MLETGYDWFLSVLIWRFLIIIFYQKDNFKVIDMKDE